MAGLRATVAIVVLSLCSSTHSMDSPWSIVPWPREVKWGDKASVRPLSSQWSLAVTGTSKVEPFTALFNRYTQLIFPREHFPDQTGFSLKNKRASGRHDSLPSPSDSSLITQINVHVSTDDLSPRGNENYTIEVRAHAYLSTNHIDGHRLWSSFCQLKHMWFLCSIRSFHCLTVLKMLHGTDT